jgi:hypothetical protein
MCVPYEQLNEILDFKVLKMTDIINQVFHLVSIYKNRHMPTGRCYQRVLRFQCGKWFR